MHYRFVGRGGITRTKRDEFGSSLEHPYKQNRENNRLPSPQKNKTHVLFVLGDTKYIKIYVYLYLYMYIYDEKKPAVSRLPNRCGYKRLT